MGTGGIRFRSPIGLAGATCVALVSACRTGAGIDDLRTTHPVEVVDGAPSFARGHRFGRWLEVEPDAPARPALERACLLEQTGASEEAMVVLSDALDDLRSCPSLFEARGALYLATGYPRAAAGDFQNAVGLAPECPHAWYALGHAYELLGLTRQSFDALERARTLGEDRANLYLSLAHVQRSLGHAGRAARAYEEALQRFDGNLTEILVEGAVLATEDRTRAGEIEAMRDRLESCQGTHLSDGAWLLRTLLKDLPGESLDEVSRAFRALELAPEDLAKFTRSVLVAVQLVDEETSAETRARLLAAEEDGERRARLERCLARP
jgi:tetratricopeptide (TPR) repeat protein